MTRGGGRRRSNLPSPGRISAEALGNAASYKIAENSQPPPELAARNQRQSSKPTAHEAEALSFLSLSLALGEANHQRARTNEEKPPKPAISPLRALPKSDAIERRGAW